MRSYQYTMFISFAFISQMIHANVFNELHTTSFRRGKLFIYDRYFIIFYASLEYSVSGLKNIFSLCKVVTNFTTQVCDICYWKIKLLDEENSDVNFDSLWISYVLSRFNIFTVTILFWYLNASIKSLCKVSSTTTRILRLITSNIHVVYLFALLW